MVAFFRTLATLFDVLTICACAFAAYLLGMVLLAGADPTDNYEVGGSMGLLVATLASGGLSVALIVPFYVLSSVFHRLWHRELAARDENRE